MQIIKPLSMSLIQKAESDGDTHKLHISPLLWFSLSNNEIVPEQIGWKKTMKCLQDGEILDVGTPKHFAEVLISGVAYPTKDSVQHQREVGITVGDKINKRLMVFGRQSWHVEEGKWALSRVLPLTPTPLNWSMSYGGRKFADNPVGIGFYDAEKPPTKELEIPRIRSIDAVCDDLNKNLVAEGFGPIPLESPVRQARAGTYDDAWLAKKTTGLADDHDPALFNSAAQDQWAENYFENDEKFELIGMSQDSDVLKGRMPGMNCRAFIKRCDSDPPTLEEVPLNIDTLWFFPEQDLGLIISRGTAQVQDSDALDIEGVLLAYEAASGVPKPNSHYENVYTLRTDPSTALAHMLNEAQLVPEKKPAQLEREEREVIRVKIERKQKIDQHLKNVNKSLIKAGAKMPSKVEADNPADETMPELPVVPPEAIARGDVDLTSMIASSKALLDFGKRQSAAAKEQNNNSAVPDIHNKSNIEVGLKSERASIDGRLARSQGNGTVLASDQVEVSKAQKLARKVAPQDSTLAKQYSSEVKSYLGQQIKKMLVQNQCLIGLDLSGADLRGCDFSGQDLSGVQFESARLTNCDFSNAKMNSVVLTGADLRGSDFSKCQFGDANLSGVNAQGVVFREASFHGTKFMNANLKGCDFQSSKFQSCKFITTQLENADFTLSQLDRCHFMQVQASQCKWSACGISMCMYIESNLDQSDFRNANVHRCIFANVAAQQSNLTFAQLKKVQFAGKTDLSGSDFTEAIGDTIGLQGVGLTKCNFSLSAFKTSNFSHCDLSDSCLDGAGFLQCLFSLAILNRVSAQNSNFMESLLRKSLWQGATLIGGCFFNVNAKQAVFKSCEIKNVANFPNHAEVSL